MTEMTSDKQMKRDDHDFLFSEEVDCCKWFVNQSITILLSNVEGMATASTVLRREKESSSKVQVPGPKIIKMYN